MPERGGGTFYVGAAVLALGTLWVTVEVVLPLLWEFCFAKSESGELL